MSTKIDKLAYYFEAYKKWVSENPETVTNVETTAKWMSYFIAGRVSNSTIVSELIYSLSNILVLFNDRIIEKANTFNSISQGVSYQIKLMLTTLEYVEVFVEITAQKLWGKRGRWLFIILLQTIKAIGRYSLLKEFSNNVIRSPPIPVLDRKKVGQDCLNESSVSFPNEPNSSFFFVLKRSGHTIRKIEGAPPLQHRNWKPLESRQKTLEKSSATRTAETMYIAKPLLHLGAIGLFGYKSWKSYTIAAIIDIMSIRLYYKNQHSMTKEQRIELSRRCVNLLLYLVRSPFYEKNSKNRLEKMLRSFAKSIPFAKSLCNPLIDYIPQWQDTYFYMWST